jgi:hypothetical protein
MHQVGQTNLDKLAIYLDILSIQHFQGLVRQLA